MDSRQKIAAVTAAGGAIGGAIARRLIEQGLAVVAIDIDGVALETLSRDMKSARLSTLTGDMTEPADVERVFGAVERVGTLRVLVNGVGSNCSGGLRDITPATWQRKFDLNLTSVLLCTRAALPLLEAGEGDRVIINISSTLATVADPETLAYGAFKAGLEQMTRALALELAPSGIRAVAIAPGPVSASGGEAEYDTPEFARLNPLGRFATADEIASVAGFLASPAAAYITGIIMRVDGGDSALGAGWGPLQALLRSQGSTR